MSPSRAEQYGGSMPAGSGSTERQPIGVPADYTVPRYANQVEINAPLVPTPPRYFEGDDFSPGNTGPDTIARLQRELVDSGLLEPNDFQLGAWDQPSRLAYRQLLTEANAAVDSWEATLRRRKNLVRQFPQETKEERLPLTARVSNPDDLRAIFKEAAKSTLGSGNIPQAELDRMVSAYQAEERRPQEQAYNAAETGGTVVDAPNPEVFADDQLHKLDPTAYDSNRVVAGLRQVFEMFGEG